jgi:uncharacterized short protein YbdD (DUF466 family)
MAATRSLHDVAAWCRDVWRGLRTATGDDAYERYLRQHALEHGDVPPLNRREFFARETERKWNGVKRCC